MADAAGLMYANPFQMLAHYSNMIDTYSGKHQELESSLLGTNAGDEKAKLDLRTRLAHVDFILALAKQFL